MPTGMDLEPEEPQLGSWWWLVAAAVLLLFGGCEAAMEPRPSPTPLPEKLVAAKVQRDHLVDPTTYHLVAIDGTVCTVRMPVYALTQPGHLVPCDWRAW